MQSKFHSSGSSSEDTKGPHLNDMLLLTILLFLTAVPDQSLGQEEDEDEEDDVQVGVRPEDQKLIVDKHNEMRRNVEPSARNMLKMSWNETIAESARRWADKCIIASSPKEDRMFGNVACGQSIFVSNFTFPWSDVVDYWNNKSRYFKYGVGALGPEQNVYGYTQAIWYRSHQIGCAVSYCPNNFVSFYYICEYCPLGNIREQISTPYKEGPPCGDCPKHCDNKLCTNPCRHQDHYPNCAQLKEHVKCKEANKGGHCKATCSCKNKIK